MVSCHGQGNRLGGMYHYVSQVSFMSTVELASLKNCQPVVSLQLAPGLVLNGASRALVRSAFLGLE